MQLSFLTVKYFRSITTGYKLNLSNKTILLGKNNRGKTNILKAIILGMDLIRNISHTMVRNKVPRGLYDWNEDFPMSLQHSRKLKDKHTEIRMDFTLSELECEEFRNVTELLFNRSLSIVFKLGNDNSLSVSLPKNGCNKTALTGKVVDICKFISEHFSIQYIPAVRSESDAVHAIMNLIDDELLSNEDPKYKEASDYIEQVENERLNNLAKKIGPSLKKFLPEIKSINISKSSEKNRRVFRSYSRDYSIEIDDGVLTSISNKGDGVKSLITIAMLSELSIRDQRLIIIDEPENHLHPEAIRYIDNVMKELSKTNQVLVSTHNPIFVNRSNISSNLIVDEGKVERAKELSSIRNVLGIVCSDNLLLSDFTILVEGSSDETVLNKFIGEDAELSKLAKSGYLAVRNIGGVSHLKGYVYQLDLICGNYLALVDYDNIATNTVDNLIASGCLSSHNVRYLRRGEEYPAEIEDLYDSKIYEEYLMSLGISIRFSSFKNRTKKWSERIDECVNKSGMSGGFTRDMQNEVKNTIADKYVQSPLKSCFTEDGYDLIVSVLEYVKMLIKSNIVCNQIK